MEKEKEKKKKNSRKVQPCTPEQNLEHNPCMSVTMIKQVKLESL